LQENDIIIGCKCQVRFIKLCNWTVSKNLYSNLSQGDRIFYVRHNNNYF